MNQLFRRAATVVMLGAAAACGGDDGNGPSGSNGSMSATIAGAAWNANLTVQGTYQGNVLGIGGNGGSGANAFQINITLTNVTAAGTFNLGPTAFGNIAVLTAVGSPVSSWTSSGVGGTGTVTVTELTSTGAKGTFSFTGTASPGTAATGTKAVTSGSFDVEF